MSDLLKQVTEGISNMVSGGETQGGASAKQDGDDRDVKSASEHVAAGASEPQAAGDTENREQSRPRPANVDPKDEVFVGSIDQGTTSSRFLIFDKAGEPVAVHQEEFRQIYPQPGYV